MQPVICTGRQNILLATVHDYETGLLNWHKWAQSADYFLVNLLNCPPSNMSSDLKCHLHGFNTPLAFRNFLALMKRQKQGVLLISSVRVRKMRGYILYSQANRTSSTAKTSQLCFTLKVGNTVHTIVSTAIEHFEAIFVVIPLDFLALTDNPVP